jgi:DNA-binding YbaB/EbfC family protein
MSSLNPRADRRPNRPESSKNDLSTLLQQMVTMRDGLLAAQAEMTSTELVGQAGGGLVTVTVRGTGEVVAVRLDPAIVGHDLPELEDLILTAMRNAQEAARAFGEQLAQPILPS